MYKILERKNYRNEIYHILIEDGIILWTINPKDIEKFLSKGYSFEDSAAIEKYKQYNNL